MRLVTVSLVAIFFLLLSLIRPYSSGKEDFQFRKEPELRQIKPKKPVRIKLRRTSTDKYTWELTGDDLEEILEIDLKLKRTLDEQ